MIHFSESPEAASTALESPTGIFLCDLLNRIAITTRNIGLFCLSDDPERQQDDSIDPACTRFRFRVAAGRSMMRAYMRGMFAEAVDLDFLYKDPAARVKLQVNLCGTDKTALT